MFLKYLKYRLSMFGRENSNYVCGNNKDMFF